MQMIMTIVITQNLEKLNIQMDFTRDSLVKVLQKSMELEDKLIALEFMKVNLKILKNMDGEERSVIQESTKKDDSKMDSFMKAKNMMRMVILLLIKS